LADEGELSLVQGDAAVVGSEIPCVELTVGSTQRLWVAPGLGNSIIRREFVGPTGDVELEYRCTNHIEVADRIWLPTRIDVAFPGEVDDGWLRIAAVGIEDLDDSIFHYERRAGDVEGTMVEGKIAYRQVTPGGREHLDDMVAWLKRDRVDVDRRGGTNMLIKVAGLAVILISALIAAKVVLIWTSRRAKAVTAVDE
jgi:hypothetical protein